MNRYHRQTLLPRIGSQGQARLGSAHVLLVGCGALGSVLADQLVRAGVGRLRLVDRDVVEWTNLQRQVLFDEADAREAAPKAVAAARRLTAVNSSVAVEPIVSDLHAGNVEDLAGVVPSGDGNSPEGISTGGRVDVILDGTDNVETRYLLNDVSVKHGIPWVYGACVGTEGRVMAVWPGRTPCLRCIFPSPPGPGELPTCDTAGVLGAAAAVVASLQATAAIRILTARESTAEEAARANSLICVDVWKGRFRSISLDGARQPDCRTCGLREFEFLNSRSGGQLVNLCGRNAVQIRPAAARTSVELASVAQRLKPSGTVELTPHLLRFRTSEPGADWQLTLFPDGRAMIQGTQDPDRAKSLYAKWVGS